MRGLSALGAEIEATRGRLVVIEGTRRPARRHDLDAHGDHRIAMLGAVAGLASREGVEVEGMEAAAVSYPGFERRPRSLLQPERLRVRDGGPSHRS